MSFLDGRHASQRDPRPHSVDDLARAMGLLPDDPELTGKLTLALGFGRRWVKRCRRWGLTDMQADTWATRAGLHPTMVWPDWPHGDRDDLVLGGQEP